MKGQQGPRFLFGVGTGRCPLPSLMQLNSKRWPFHNGQCSRSGRRSHQAGRTQLSRGYAQRPTQQPAAELAAASDPVSYRENRWNQISALETTRGFRPYPHYASTPGLTCSIQEFVGRFQHLLPEERLPGQMVALTGRITSKRASGKRLFFYDLASGGAKLQVMAVSNSYKPSDSTLAPAETEFLAINDLLRKGDIIEVEGFPARTKTGELSIIPHRLKLLSPCVQPLPSWDGLKDPEIRQRRRYLDLLSNPSVQQTFLTRAKIIQFLRTFLNEREFLEVETPILYPSAGGANALPFETHSKAHNMPLYMRIAPELFLKQLVIGGMERVYEIGKCFRNEGVDAMHNPEFTTIELYQAMANYEDMMSLTEQMLHEMVVAVCGSSRIKIPKVFAPLKSKEMDRADCDDDGSLEIDFTPPYRRVYFVEELEKILGMKFKAHHLTDGEPDEELRTIYKNQGLGNAPSTTAKLLDGLCGHFIEKKCIQPTFVCDHPLLLSPLSKEHSSKPGCTERFELFVAGRELCNAYTELNDPREQRRRFEAQSEAKRKGDTEAQPMDEAFCLALEYGLPPTGGWGMGIDRLCMLLSGHTHIRDVQLFPTIKTEDKEEARKDTNNSATTN
ncbi:Lysine--tRNA ligase [Balamuthia mandrillaris]